MNIQIFSSKSSKDILEYYYIRFCEHYNFRKALCINKRKRKKNIDLK